MASYIECKDRPLPQGTHNLNRFPNGHNRRWEKKWNRWRQRIICNYFTLKHRLQSCTCLPESKHYCTQWKLLLNRCELAITYSIERRPMVQSFPASRMIWRNEYSTEGSPRIHAEVPGSRWMLYSIVTFTDTTIKLNKSSCCWPCLGRYKVSVGGGQEMGGMVQQCGEQTILGGEGGKTGGREKDGSSGHGTHWILSPTFKTFPPLTATQTYSKIGVCPGRPFNNWNIAY